MAGLLPAGAGLLNVPAAPLGPDEVLTVSMTGVIGSTITLPGPFRLWRVIWSGGALNNFAIYGATSVAGTPLAQYSGSIITAACATVSTAFDGLLVPALIFQQLTVNPQTYGVLISRR